MFFAYFFAVFLLFYFSLLAFLFFEFLMKPFFVNFEFWKFKIFIFYFFSLFILYIFFLLLTSSTDVYLISLSATIYKSTKDIDIPKDTNIPSLQLVLLINFFSLKWFHVHFIYIFLIDIDISHCSWYVSNKTIMFFFLFYYINLTCVSIIKFFDGGRIEMENVRFFCFSVFL